jgi:hypothetical protein
MTKPYKSELSLDRVGQPYITAGGGSLGGFFRAGISLGFGDMLGGQQVVTTVQVGKGLNDFATQAAYTNVASRWHWGLVGGQVPWLAGGSRTFVSGAEGGERTITRERVVFRQIHRQFSGAASYPFSRARRIEFRGGFHSIAFDREVNTSLFAGRTRTLMEESTSREAAAPDAGLVETAAALVYDTSLSGPTSAILGQRYRFEVAPTFGHLRFTTLTLDYRKYFMPKRPFTIALRLKHVGRYGLDGGDPRLLPVIWTLRDSVRGYASETLSSRPCSNAISTECGSTAYLRTRRLAVANMELRFPIIGALRGTADYGPLPLEGLAFFDAGAFWAGGLTDTPGLFRTTLKSAGAGFRLNAAGVVFELTGVRRLDRTSLGRWTVGFNIRPGF